MEREKEFNLENYKILDEEDDLTEISESLLDSYGESYRDKVFYSGGSEEARELLDERIYEIQAGLDTEYNDLKSYGLSGLLMTVGVAGAASTSGLQADFFTVMAISGGIKFSFDAMDDVTNYLNRTGSHPEAVETSADILDDIELEEQDPSGFYLLKYDP